MSTEMAVVYADSRDGMLTVSAAEASVTIAGLMRTAETCLQRCAQAPYPSAEREERIRVARRDVADINQRAAVAFAEVTDAARSQLKAMIISCEAARSEVTSLAEAIRIEQAEYQLIRNQLLQSFGGTNPQDAEAKTNLRLLDEDHSASMKKKQAAVDTGNALLATLQQAQNALTRVSPLCGDVTLGFAA